MKKILIAIAAAIFIVYPSICFASYVFHLKDGRNRSKKVSRKGAKLAKKSNEKIFTLISNPRKGLSQRCIGGGGARGNKKDGRGQFRMLDFRFVTT